MAMNVAAASTSTSSSSLANSRSKSANPRLRLAKLANAASMDDDTLASPVDDASASSPSPSPRSSASHCSASERPKKHPLRVDVGAPARRARLVRRARVLDVDARLSPLAFGAPDIARVARPIARESPSREGD